jgi:cytochrome c
MKYTNLPFLGFFALSVFFFGACNTASEKKQIQRPSETWVLRSVLDKKPRMLSIALHDKLYVAYDTKNGSLYKAWTGGINFDGPVYTTAHGPQPTSLGTAYLQGADDNPWRIIANGQEITPEVDYRGHTILNNQVTLKYELEYNGQNIIVEERPEFVDAGSEKTGLERTFTTTHIPSGVQVGLHMQLASMTAANDYKTDGKFTVGNTVEETIENKKFATVEGTLLLNNNAPTTFTTFVVPKPVVNQGTEQKLEGRMR